MQPFVELLPADIVEINFRNHAFNTRSFFPGREFKDLGGGLRVWRGYFQSESLWFIHGYVANNISIGVFAPPKVVC